MRFDALLEYRLGRVAPEQLGGRWSHQWIAPALGLAIGSLAALTIIPAVAQGPTKPNALKEAVERVFVGAAAGDGRQG